MKLSLSCISIVVGLLALSGNARAQPRHVELAANDPLLVPVVLPPTPAELAPRVAQLRTIASKTIECFTEHGERSEHIADRHCPRWYAQLERGGPASAYAIGNYLVAPNTVSATPDGEPGEYAVDESDGSWTTGPRLVRLLAASDPGTAAPFLVAYLAKITRESYINQEIVRAVAEVLPRVTGNDVSPLAPWASIPNEEATTTWRGVARDWLSWWHGASADPRDKWLTDGARHARELLGDADALRRFVAIQHLASSAEDRDAVRASWGELMGRGDLPSNVRAYLTRYGRRNHLPAGPGAVPARLRVAS